MALSIAAGRIGDFEMIFSLAQGIMAPLEQSIFSALVYFDMFDYPLTLLELHRWLYRPEREYSVNEVTEALSRSFLQRVVSSQHGFFYLAGRKGIVQERQRRYRLSAGKHRRARRLGWFLAAVPFVRMIAVSGSLAYHNARLDSDIDLIILTKRGGVWRTRFIALIILHFLRLRPGQGGTADKICLSIFADEDNFNFQRLLINQDDIDFVFWLANIYPLYGMDYYLHFWRANKWLKDYLLNTRQALPALSFLRPAFAPPFAKGGASAERAKQESSLKYSIEKLLAPFSGAVRRLQCAFFPPAIRALINKDTRVRVEEGLLKFHTTDRRRQYQAEFTRKMSMLLNDFVV